jgi:hypothetical protein
LGAGLHFCGEDRFLMLSTGSTAAPCRWRADDLVALTRRAEGATED